MCCCVNASILLSTSFARAIFSSAIASWACPTPGALLPDSSISSCCRRCCKFSSSAFFFCSSCSCDERSSIASCRPARSSSRRSRSRNSESCSSCICISRTSWSVLVCTYCSVSALSVGMGGGGPLGTGGRCDRHSASGGEVGSRWLSGEYSAPSSISTMSPPYVSPLSWACAATFFRI